MIRTNKKDEDMKSGDRRRGLYTFAYEQEAEAWDALFPTRSEISKLIKRNANAGEFINAKALIALSDKRTGNFIHPIFVNMLEQRLTELGYTIVDEAFKLGAPQREVMQHVNYYYDTVAIQIEQLNKVKLNFTKIDMV